MRTLLADAVLSVTTTLLRWMDPSIHDVHAVRREGFFDGLPLVTDPCAPRSTVYISNGYGSDEKRV